MSRGVRSVVFDGGLLVLGGDDRLFLLDELAAQIWHAIESGLSSSEITEALTEANPEQSASIRRDVTTLLSQWRDKGLLDQTAPIVRRPPMPAPLFGESAWATKWRCRFGDLVVEIAVEDPQQSELLGRRFEHFLTNSADPSACVEVRKSPDGGVVFVDGHEYARTYTVRNVQRALLGLVWPSHPVCALIHAGAVALGDKVACFAGVSGSGKTTLIARLVSKGFTYLADDLAAVSACGRVLPWPMPMSVKLGSWDTLSESYPTLETAPIFEVKGTLARSLKPATDAWRLGPTKIQVIIFPRYLRGGATQLSRLTQLDALRCLIKAGFLIESPISTERAETVLQWLGTVPVYSLSYGDVDEAAASASYLLGAA